MRRVVTAVDKQGKAVFVSDGEPEIIHTVDGAAPVSLVWGWDESPSIPNDGAKPSYRNYFPPAGGMRVIVVPIHPDSDRVALDPGVANERFPGLFTDVQWEPDEPGMHTTRTVDVGLIVDGPVILELDDGATRQLDAGDWYVVNGTKHAWRNPFDKPALLAIFMTAPASDAG